MLCMAKAVLDKTFTQKDNWKPLKVQNKYHPCIVFPPKTDHFITENPD